MALVQRIPVAHIHGGELSEGAIDDAIRHAITKMAHLHFVAAEPYRKRVIQLGEKPERVFNVGAPGLERIKKKKLLSRELLEQSINTKLRNITFVITYLPATLNIHENAAVLQSLFDALDRFPEATLIFTKANADEAGRLVNTKVDEYVFRNAYRAASYTTLGDLNYLSLLQFIDVVIGNSSSGLIEAPYFKKPTINIGDRQKSRLRASSVIDCHGNAKDITLAIEKALSPEFQQTLTNIDAPYVQDDTASKIISIIKNSDMNNIMLKKFNDLFFNEIVTSE